MKKYLSLLILCAAVQPAQTQENQELRLLGRTVIYENGSWVNPDEPKFKAKKPKTWVKRNYVRHYMQGSQEITDSIIHFNWTKFKEAAKTGEKVKLNEVLTLFKFKDTLKAAKKHPEAVVVPVGMAAGSAVEGSKGTVIATIGLAKNLCVTTLKVIKFVGKPVTKLIPVRAEN